MISELCRSSADFARLWEGSAVAHQGSERKTIDHPQVAYLVSIRAVGSVWVVSVLLAVCQAWFAGWKWVCR